MKTNPPCVEAALCEAGAASDLFREAHPSIFPKDGGGTSFGQSRLYTVAIFLAISLVAAQAQEPRPATAGVDGIKGVKEDAVANVNNVETGNAATSTAQGVNKINGVETINGVKAAGRTVVPPTGSVVPPPPPPPVGAAPPPPSPPPSPPPIVSAGGTAVPAGGGSVGTAANIRAIKGVSGINSAKLQNLEKALILKQGGGGTPTGTGAENGGKGKSAAAALLAAPLEKKPGPKEDGRAGFQEFEKLQNNGS
jgi:hypothetical protein